MAAKIFRQDNPYNVVMGRIGDLAMLSVAWFVGCIPVFTIGASTAAASEVALEMLEGADDGIFRGYWRAFRRRFGTSVAMTGILAVFWLLAAFDLYFTGSQTSDAGSLIFGVTIAVCVVVGMLTAFVFPMAGRAEKGPWRQIRRSSRMALAKPLVALVAFVIEVLPIVLLLFVPGAASFVPLLWFVLCGGLGYWLIMLLVRRSFGI
ncbi:YesL family protein [Bifidobacterium choloepi]|uniref:DUF624 domain-containing protein n=1 Tax=Bifidobacterium choloepi TaxID=2614131 RepID=A0A6I5NBL5_9BIFI|nr:YesL family protein [Bifidobacterium choloepi]NEG69890.1 DUF624 domain-containing protein [Bifidobacterium choloepi]